MKNVENKVIIITGATSGIGEATARVLAANGAKVVLSGRREDRLEKLASELKNKTSPTKVKEICKLSCSISRCSGVNGEN